MITRGMKLSGDIYAHNVAMAMDFALGNSLITVDNY